MKTTESLEQRIESAVEHLVREHLASCQAAVTSAVGEAFRRASGGTAGPRSRPKKPRGTSTGPKRSRDEIAQLMERLYDAIVEQPGETMSVLASSVGASPRELSLPRTLLRRDGRVRSVGRRQATRYFPMGA